MVLGTVMSVLDMTIVNVALRRLSESFGAPLETIQWTATAYTLALAAVIPTAGWAMSRIGARRTYMTALALFTLGSLLAACAWDAGSLIAFRAVQGLGGGLLQPVGMAMGMRVAGPGPAGPGDGAAGTADPGRTGGRAGARRLAGRLRLLAVDLPDQPARRRPGAAPRGPPAAEGRPRPRTARDRPGWTCPGC
ncbi:MFS transporter [Streptomyces tricolor]|nr:MFS transporter [Streptomyces tricolor]